MWAIFTCEIWTAKREDKTYAVHFQVLLNINCETKTYSNRLPNHLFLLTMVSTSFCRLYGGSIGGTT